MSSNADCDNGDKFVLKNKARVNRRQFLFMDGKTILAFVPVGQKFSQCSSYTEVTAQVDCKVLQYVQLYLTNYPSRVDFTVWQFEIRYNPKSVTDFKSAHCIHFN